ncbi:MAG: hypothetical protein GYB68_02360 [Chloroflexi bacterium]|nr:hypothetical protein [Chloroflexota bacterium]
MPPSDDPDPFEPNDDYNQATGPLASGDSVQGYISWADDLDVFFLQTASRQPIQVSLTGIPSGEDFDLFLLDDQEVLASSEGTTQEEFIEFVPPAAGVYFIAVAGWDGSSSASSPYTLTVTYDGGAAGTTPQGARAFGRVVNQANGNLLFGGIFGVLNPGVTCSQFSAAGGGPSSELVAAAGETNAQGFFELLTVPTGQSLAAFFLFDGRRICADGFETIPDGSLEWDMGLIEVSFD